MKEPVMEANDTSFIDMMVSIIRNSNISQKTAQMAGYVIVAHDWFNFKVFKGKTDPLPEGIDNTFEDISKKMVRLLDFVDEIMFDCRNIFIDTENNLDEKIIYEKLTNLREKLNDFTLI